MAHAQEVRAGLDRALDDSDEFFLRGRTTYSVDDARRTGLVHLVVEARDDLLEWDARFDLDDLDGVFRDADAAGHAWDSVCKLIDSGRPGRVYIPWNRSA